MKALIAMMALLGAVSAQADGFVCSTQDDSLTIKVYNNVQPEEGTRNAAVMVLSDPAVQAGRKTIARFTDVNGTLDNSGALYVADVDLRFNDSGRKGELILGTKLGQLKKIVLNIDFSFAQPIADGESTEGTIRLAKRDGSSIRERVECVRYLKGSF